MPRSDPNRGPTKSEELASLRNLRAQYVRDALADYPSSQKYSANLIAKLDYQIAGLKGGRSYMTKKSTKSDSASFRKDLERMVWSYKHRDYKSTIDGKKYVTIFRTGKGTCLEPLSSISDDDLISLLGSATQADFNARKPRSHLTKRHRGMGGGESAPGRSYVEASEAGDAYQVETLDGKHHLFMPGSRGKKQTLANARKHWKHRIGERVRLYHVLPGSRIGAMMLKEAGEATL